MEEISENERKQIECRTILKKYLEGVFADERLEKMLFNRKQDIELLRVKCIEINTKGKKATVVYGINGIGAYRRVEDPSLFQDTLYFRWGHHNSSFALEFALAGDSGYALKPDDLEAKLGQYRKMAVGNAAVAPEAGK